MLRKACANRAFSSSSRKSSASTMDSVSKTTPTLQFQLFGTPEIRLAGVAYPGLAAKTQALLFDLSIDRAGGTCVPRRRRCSGPNAGADARQLAQGDPAIAGEVRRYSPSTITRWACERTAVLGGCRRVPHRRRRTGRTRSARRELSACGPAIRRGIAGFDVRNAPEFEAWMLAEKDGCAGRCCTASKPWRVRLSRRMTFSRRSRSPGAS